jgi:Ca2+-binding EF-hand superfamily protein
LSPEKEAELKKLFASYDVNNDGVISAEELKQAFGKIGHKVSDDELTQMVSLFFFL